MREPPCAQGSGLQEVEGKLLSFQTNEVIMVWSEGWPSWVLALQGIGFQDIPFWIHDARPTMSKALQALGLSNNRCWTWDKATFLGASSSRLLIQGTQAFVLAKRQAALAMGIPSANMLAVEDISIQGVPDQQLYSQAKVLSHRQVGGVTNGRWALWGTDIRDRDGLEARLGLTRHVGDILSSTNGGLSSDSPDQLRCQVKRRCRSFVYPYELLPVHSPDSEIIAPCVFSQTKFVKRTLSPTELWDAYDIGALSQSSLPTSSNGKRPWDLSFAWAAPLKILHRALSCWLPLQPSSVSSILSQDVSEPSWTECPLGSPLFRFDPVAASPIQDGPAIKAVKHDDAQVNSNLWNIRALGAFRPNDPTISPLVCGQPLNEDVLILFDGLRRLGFRRFQTNLRKSFTSYIRTTYGDGVLLLNSPFRQWQIFRREEALKQSGKKRKRHQAAPPVSATDHQWRQLELDLEVGRDALRRGVGANWWEWSLGSTLFFWRWPQEYRRQARDGVRIFVLDDKRLPRYWKRQQWPKDPAARAKVEEKIQKVRDNRGYLERNHVLSLTGFFAVPKGSDDIRMVYDATKCGLNDALWAPNFSLPTVDSIIHSSSKGTWFGDIDLGEMFLNYPLDRRIRPYAGVDTYHNDGPTQKRVLHRWNRNAMGLMPSPYNSTQGFAVSSEVITGDVNDSSNPLSWDSVILNMPGTTSYDPCMPWCYRWNSVRQEMPGFFKTYVDDIRTG